MPLDPRVKRFLDVLAAGKPPNALETSVEQRRLGPVELMKLGQRLLGKNQAVEAVLGPVSRRG